MHVHRYGYERLLVRGHCILAWLERLFTNSSLAMNIHASAIRQTYNQHNQSTRLFVCVCPKTAGQSLRNTTRTHSCQVRYAKTGISAALPGLLIHESCARVAVLVCR